MVKQLLMNRSKITQGPISRPGIPKLDPNMLGWISKADELDFCITKEKELV